MKKLGHGPQAKQLLNAKKASWVCLIAALAFCLWGANVLPIQQVEYQLTTNLAISQHRMPLLKRLRSKTLESASDKTSFSALEILPDDSKLSPSANSELRSIRVKMRFPIRGDIRLVEKSLNELTTPSLESNECQGFAMQLLKEKWHLESCAHSIKQVILDIERENNAIEIDRVDTGLAENDVFENDSMADRVVEASRSLNPFRLISFGTIGSRPLSQSELIDNLRDLNQVRSENVEAMMLSLERLKAKARGFLSITGAPRVDPVVRPLTLFRFLILLVLCTSVWLLLIAWLHPIRGNLLFWVGTPHSNETIPVTRKTASKSDSSTAGMKKTIHWMQREGIPYLGEIQILSSETSAARGRSIVNSSVADCISARNEDISFTLPTNYFKSITTLRSLSEGSLVLWMGLFVARVLFDPVWRELVTVAPLAAISRMITGIQ